jgi:hypothetical protein
MARRLYRMSLNSAVCGVINIVPKHDTADLMRLTLDATSASRGGGRF